MAIDPLLYEKVSGRKGDPYSRMGEALAGSDSAKAQRTEEKDRSYTEASMIARYKFQLYAAAAGGVVLVIFVIARALFG
jgi:hypothetical protein